MSKKTGRRDRDVALGVVFFNGVAVPEAMTYVVEQQKERCAISGCNPHVRVTQGNIYFAHDDWCPTVGGKGQ